MHKSRDVRIVKTEQRTEAEVTGVENGKGKTFAEEYCLLLCQ